MNVEDKDPPLENHGGGSSRGVGTVLIWDFCIAYTRGGGICCVLLLYTCQSVRMGLADGWGHSAFWVCRFTLVLGPHNFACGGLGDHPRGRRGKMCTFEVPAPATQGSCCRP